MNILLLGYGKMGKAIESIAVSNHHTIIGKVDNVEERNRYAQQNNIDVAIEFSQPDAAPDNLRFCFDNKIPVVCGTTGWLDAKEQVDQYCKLKNGAFLYASNFSLGVNIFFHLNKVLAQLMKDRDEYTVSLDETHHTQKKDAPSGTAISVAEDIIDIMPRWQGWTQEGNLRHDQIVIQSHRIDPAPGTHVVNYQSVIDTIEIKHTAHSRQGFAVGALVAAEWLRGRTGVFTMADFLGF